MKKILLILLITISTCCFGQNQQQVIDSLFYGKAGVKAKDPTVGLVTGIYSKGKAHYYSLGTRIVKGSALLDSATIFEIGSATKTFTGLLLAINIEQHKVDKNDLIDRYLPVDYSFLKSDQNNSLT